MVSDTAAITTPHHRHPQHTCTTDYQPPVQNRGQDAPTAQENAPLIKHMSMVGEDTAESRRCAYAKIQHRRIRILLVVVPVLVFFVHTFYTSLSMEATTRIIPIEDAVTYTIEVDEGISVWFRTWGRPSGVPVLFVHGGPGNAVADYHDGNKRFFDASKCFVVEIDQRGTGNSQPSVRDDWRNMKYYSNISIDMIARDFEVVREFLGIDQWLVWGGSYGSTVGLNYGMRYPESCLALILRGIYLDTRKELKEVYTLNAFKASKKRAAQFNLLYKVAADDAANAGEEPLDPNDEIRLLRIYERMIAAGDQQSIWNWHAFENNLMEEDPKNLLDPEKIVEDEFAEAQSVAFFETRLWLHGSVEQPSYLLDRVDQLAGLPVWICQGLRDKVCPPENAKLLMTALDKARVELSAYFIPSGHEDTGPVMEKCLQRSMGEFLDQLIED